MTTVKSYVISLARRPERLDAFMAAMRRGGVLEVCEFEVFAAVDGSQLSLEELHGRIDPWNLEHMDDRRLRGNLGCTLSHIGIWERIAQSNDRMVAVFEDDARLLPGCSGTTLRSGIARVRDDADLVWLNDYDLWNRGGPGYHRQRRLRSLFSRVMGASIADRLLGVRALAPLPDTLTTTEAYLLRPAYARALIGSMRDNLGAVDQHMRLHARQHGGTVLQMVPPLFTQNNRDDSDTRSESEAARARAAALR